MDYSNRQLCRRRNRQCDRQATRQTMQKNTGHPRNGLFLRWVFLLFKYFILFFRERDGEGERERNTNVQETHHRLLLAHPHPGISPQPRHVHWELCRWELNRRPLGSQAGTHSTEPHQPGLFLTFVMKFFTYTQRSLYYPTPIIIHFPLCFCH